MLFDALSMMYEDSEKYFPCHCTCMSVCCWHHQVNDSNLLFVCCNQWMVDLLLQYNICHVFGKLHAWYIASKLSMVLTVECMLWISALWLTLKVPFQYIHTGHWFLNTHALEVFAKKGGGCLCSRSRSVLYLRYLETMAAKEDEQELLDGLQVSLSWFISPGYSSYERWVQIISWSLTCSSEEQLTSRATCVDSDQD